MPVREYRDFPAIIFLTVCTDKRKQILCREEVHAFLNMAWNAADAWHVGKYVVMPDHIHLFCAPSKGDVPSLTRWVIYWKSFISRRWPWPSEQPIWQKSFWDTQMRTWKQYDKKWEYVHMNPVRKGLVERPDDWPFQGDHHFLEGHVPS